MTQLFGPPQLAHGMVIYDTTPLLALDKTYIVTVKKKFPKIGITNDFIKSVVLVKCCLKVD